LSPSRFLDLSDKDSEEAIATISKTFKELKYEEVLEVVCEHNDFFENLRHFVEINFYELRDVIEDESGVLHYFIVKPMIMV